MFVPHRRRARRGGCFGALLRLVLLLLLAAAAAVGWYYSGLVLGPDSPPPLDDQAVLAATDSTVTLSAAGNARTEGTWALEWKGGYGELTGAAELAGNRVSRRFRAIAGRPPVGGRASVLPYAFAADPLALRGLPFEQVAITTPAGVCPAWLVKAASSGGAWAIVVHGRGAVRAQALAITPALLGLGWNVLVPSYRNDPGAARSADGRYRLGATEWRDLEAAVRWARGHGARRIVLVGYSMGAQIALQFMRHSPLASSVEGLVLESPLLRWRPVLDVAARERGVPPAVTSLAMFVTRLRAGIDWDDLDLVAHARDFGVPILAFHGLADTKVPIASSEAFAARRPEFVTLVRVIGAGHVRCWNVDPDGFEAALTSWMRRLDSRP